MNTHNQFTSSKEKNPFTISIIPLNHFLQLYEGRQPC